MVLILYTITKIEEKIMKVVIVLPTYNEKENIENFINALLSEFSNIEINNDFDLNILIVDDYSPDGTAKIVEEKFSDNKKINILMNNNRGLGNAYIAGFKYALNKFSPDILMEMDSDFSHNPKNIINLLDEIKNGADFVIGSRYVKGGTLPKHWGLFRIMNSKFGNIFARFVAGIYSVKDCTGGFRAMKKEIFEKNDIQKIKAEGYCFQIALLKQVYKYKFVIREFPIHFTDRKAGKSKLRIKDILEFIYFCFVLRFKK